MKKFNHGFPKTFKYKWRSRSERNIFRQTEYKKYPEFEIYYHDHITVFFKMKDKKIK